VTQPIGFGWMASDLHPLGTAGDASTATAEKGEACAENGAEAFLDLLRDVLAFDLARLRDGPLAGPKGGPGP
jgi:creatinine amidohydrolase